MRLALACIYVLFFTIGCSTTKSRTEHADMVFSSIVRKTKDYNDTATKGKVLLQIKDFNPTKQLLSRVSKEISNSTDFVYLFTWHNELPSVTLEFSAILLDRSANKKYYIFNNGEKSIQITTKKPRNFASHDLVFEEFVNGRIESLHGMQNLFSSAEVGQDYSIYSIDLTGPEVSLMHFSDVVVLQH